jgi:crotonobetainyl-CoA:carnitine CoA-transferase CaiB-like acyl-CoA transferase
LTLLFVCRRLRGNEKRGRLMAGALKGLRILDMTAVVLGPYAMQLLGDQGADVIKVEPPEGEMLRHIGPSRVNPGMGPLHLGVNRSKRSLALDLKKPEALAALHKVIAGADALVHAMRPQAMKKLGLDYDSVNKINPGIVYVGAYGYRADGPYGDRPAYDDVIQAVSGVAWLNGMHDGIPKYAPTIIADKTVGLTLAYAVLAALVHKLRTGEGQSVEVPMFETMAQYLLIEHMFMRSFAPEENKPGYNRMMAPGRKPYRSADGWVSILPYTQRHFANFFRIAGRDDLANDARYTTVAGRSHNIVELYERITEIAATKTTAEWLEKLMQAEIPCGPINSLEDILADPHLNAGDLFVTMEHPTEGAIRMVNPPVRFSASPSEITRPAPLVGEHSREVLREAGVPEAEIAALVERGIVVEPKGKAQ